MPEFLLDILLDSATALQLPWAPRPPLLHPDSDMGPRSYILNGVADLPKFPVRAACSFLAEPSLQGEDLLAALARAVAVFYNASGTSDCLAYDAAPNPASQEVGELWG